MVTMGSMRGRPARRIGLGVGIAAFAAVVAIAMWTPTDHRTAPHASATASAAPSASGPVVYYEVLDADASRLMERRLDGRSLPREVASRTDAEYGRTWTVDPTGTTAVSMVAGVDDQRLEAVSVATGATLWSARTPVAPPDQAAWSADGRRLAIASLGGDATAPEALVVDAASGSVVRVVIPDDAILQGFDVDGALILRQQLPSPEGVNVGWRFLRVDPVTATLQRVLVIPDVGPASDGSEDVDPAAGLAVETTRDENRAAIIRLVSLGGGPARTLATLPSTDRIGFDPAGTGVAISAEGSIRFIGLDGGSAELFAGPDPIVDFGWSAGGDYLAVATEGREPSLTIVERATGRAVGVPPQGDPVAQLLFVRVVGGVPLPADPLPATEPSPTPTAGPAGADVAGFDGLLTSWVDRSGGTQVAHVERLVPTVAGGLRVAASMPPLDLGPKDITDEDGPAVAVLPGPGTSELLVWVSWSDRASGWLWDGAAGRRPLALPADWPATTAYDVAWRPDGGALAASATLVGMNGDTTEVFAIATLGARTTTIVPAPATYDQLEGWWSATELRVGHVVCTEGCTGRFSLSARLRVRDHRLRELVPADRAHGVVDSAVVDRGAIVLSIVNDDPGDDIVIDWPAALGPVDNLGSIGFLGDGRTLLVNRTGRDGTDVYRIDDPVRRSVAGRLRDPDPILLIHVGGPDPRIDVSPDAAWATVVDRVEDVRLVQIADGRSWPVDRDRSMAWLGQTVAR
jgi:hypothetical protein